MSIIGFESFGLSIFLKVAFLLTVFLVYHSSAIANDENTIIEEWDKVKAPAPVDLKAIKIDPERTAFLVLDIEEMTCNQKRRPRCVASVPKIKKFLEKARGNGLTVIYSLTSKGKPETILAGVTPLSEEPIVQSSVDKFYNTELEKILKAKEIKTVIVVGTTAEGAVLHTATGAAMRGFQVVIPIEGISAGTLYAEQYTAWHLINAPGSRWSTTLTKFHMIDF